MANEPVQMPRPSDRFNRNTVRADGRLLVKSVCLQCGESKVGSVADGSLTGWEHKHECKKVTVFPGSPEKCGHA
jgi:hypothetical protein